MIAIYNEIDPFAAQWMRNLIAEGHIAPGEVNERSITDLTPADVAGPGQRHFFAGIGGWSYALRLAGIPDDADVWTGSCPCQPFSSAGSRAGINDERHLWPAWFRLIQECRPPVVFGEQVSSPEVIGDQGEGGGVPEEVSTEASSEGLDSSRGRTSSRARASVRSGPARTGDSSPHQQGDLRGYGAPSKSRWRSHLGQSLAGQDCPCCGLSLLEHEDRLPCGEWRDGRLGRAGRHRDGSRDSWQTQAEVKRTVDALGRSLAEESGGAWIDLVQSNLESAGYSVGFSVLPAAGVGAPHIRQRLYFVAYADEFACGQGRPLTRGSDSRMATDRRVDERLGRSGSAIELGDASGSRSGRDAGAIPRAQAQGEGAWLVDRRERDEPVDASAERDNGRKYTGPEPKPEWSCDCGHRSGEHEYGTDDCRRCSCCYLVVADPTISRCERAEEWEERGGQCRTRRNSEPSSGAADAMPARWAERRTGTGDRSTAGSGGSSELVGTDVSDSRDRDESRSGRLVQPAGNSPGHWGDIRWIDCSDGKRRPIPTEPKIFPLAHGVPNRVGTLRGSGNAIVPQVAAEFIRAAEEARGLK